MLGIVRKECGVFDSWQLRTVLKRWRAAVAFAAVAAALAALAGCWGALCLGRAEACLVQRNSGAAADWIERSLWLGRKADARTCLLQIRVARRLGDFEDVERKLQQAAQLGAPPAKLARERLLAMAQTSQFSAMQSQWPVLLRDPRDDGPEIARAYYTWSMLRHNLDQARKTLALWHADYPRDPEPLILTGRLFQSLLNWKAAEDAYREALALAPDDDDCRLALATALLARLKTAEAIPLYQEYLRRRPDDLAGIQGLAQCAATNGEMDEAIRLLRETSDRNPDDFATQMAYGEVLLSAGDATAAVPILEKARRSVPEHANLANSLARALKACGRAAEAEPLFAFVAESRPQLDELLSLEKQLQLQPDSLELRMKIAGITAKYVSRRDAIRWYQHLLLVAPDYLPAHRALAELYRLTGDEVLADHHANCASGNPQTTKSSPDRYPGTSVTTTGPH